jgi:hypothetical protein
MIIIKQNSSCASLTVITVMKEATTESADSSNPLIMYKHNDPSTWTGGNKKFVPSRPIDIELYLSLSIEFISIDLILILSFSKSDGCPIWLRMSVILCWF